MPDNTMGQPSNTAGLPQAVPGPCPGCGRCNTCGRMPWDSAPMPYAPQPWPHIPQPWVSPFIYTTCGTTVPTTTPINGPWYGSTAVSMTPAEIRANTSCNVAGCTIC